MGADDLRMNGPSVPAALGQGGDLMGTARNIMEEGKGMV